jgi:hypothetical protein
MDWEKNIGGSNADKVNEEAMTKYLPQYTDNEKATFKAITDVCTEEIRRVRMTSTFMLLFSQTARIVLLTFVKPMRMG